MYQYLEDEAGAQAKAFQGFLVGAFSLGQIVGAPFWGWLSTKHGYLPIFVVSIFLRLCGNLMYAFTHNFNPNVAGFGNSSDVPLSGSHPTHFQQQKEWYMAGSRLVPPTLVLRSVSSSMSTS
jgi:MFS family permease